jgi:dCMP deaminase
MNKNKAHKLLWLAGAVAQFSKDKSTQVGAVIIGPEGEGGPWGYNGAPRGCSADEDDRQQRPEKYFWFEHAERNALYTAARTGFRTIGCAMVITHPPCMDCARAIVQAGISKVVWNIPTPEFEARWASHYVRIKRLFNECGVSYEQWALIPRPVELK